MGKENNLKLDVEGKSFINQKIRLLGIGYGQNTNLPRIENE